MAKGNKYGVRKLRREFPTDKACLEFLFKAFHNHRCSCGGRYSLLNGRKKFQCSKCRFQIAPTSGTIFEKSSTPLTLWFHAIMVFSNAKSGISSKQLERELEVTYKCAWRILDTIRASLTQSIKKLQGVIETDAAYIGGKKSGGKNNERLSEALKAKSVAMVAIKRGGEMRAKITPNMGGVATHDFLVAHVEKVGTRLMTDKSRNYERAGKEYIRESVDHHRKEYTRGDVYVNSAESFWSHVKRSVSGTHKVVSKKHLPSYLNGFVFHYNNRYNDKARFEALLGVLILASPRQ